MAPRAHGRQNATPARPPRPLLSREARRMFYKTQAAGDPTSDRHVPSSLHCPIEIHPPSAATAPTCKSDCKTCFCQFLSLEQQSVGQTYETAINDQDAASKITSMVTAINDNLEYIRSRLEDHGDAVAKRWQRRTQAKRADVLTNAMPDIYQRKWMQHTLMREMLKSYGPEDLPKFRRQWLLRWLDLPTLVEEPSRLLTLLHHRSHADSSEWIPFDAQEIQHCFVHEVLIPNYNPHCVFVSGPAFGSLVQWTRDAAHRKEILGFPVAELVFESQSLLSDFLRKVIDLLIAPHAKDTPLSSDKWYQSVALAFGSPNTVLQCAYINAAFSAPPKYNHEYVIDRVLARCRAFEDEVWQLQTDPSFVRDMLLAVKQNPSYPALTEDSRRNRLVRSMVSPLGDYNNFCVVLEQARWLHEMSQECGNSLPHSQDLPEQYEIVLELQERFLRDLYETKLHDIWLLCTCMHTFQHHFHFEPSTSKNNGAGSFIKFGSGDLFEDDPLFWNISRLCSSFKTSRFDPRIHFGMIDGIVGTDLHKKGKKSRMTQELYDRLSDAVVIHEALVSVRYHRPAHRASALSSFELRDRLMAIRGTSMKSAHACQSFEDMAFTEFVFSYMRSRLHRLWPVLEDFLNLPLSTARDSTQVAEETITQSYRTLARFWEEVGQLGEETFLQQRQKYRVEASHLYRFREFSSATPRNGFWEGCQDEIDTRLGAIRAREAAEQRRHGPRTDPNVDLATTSHGVALSPQEIVSPSMQTIWGRETRSDPVFAITKDKVKSRPSVTENLNDAIAGMSIKHDVEPPMPRATVVVKASSKQLLRRLYTADPTAKQPVRWDNFVAAMIDAGFSGAHSGGSAVTFRDERQGKGAIVFHRPHPVATLDDVKLRGMGKRLNKWFGWDTDSFVIRED